MRPPSSRRRIACLLVRIANGPVIQEKTLYKLCAPPTFGGAQLETSRTRLCNTGGADIALMSPFSHKPERTLRFSGEQVLGTTHGPEDIFPRDGVKD